MSTSVKTLMFLLGIFASFFSVKNIFAGESPALVSPSNNTTTSSTKLEWQSVSYPLYSSSPYRVQVDNNNDFSSIEKDYYTKNTSYTPSLTEGLWYWKVKAKDEAGTWSDWSTIWSFTLSSATSPPTPTPIPTPTPTPSPSVSSSSVFQISNTPNKINTDQSFNVNTQITGLTPNTVYYLKGAFYKSGSTNYFGKTKVGNDWIKNSVTSTSQYSITSDSGGNFNGSLEVMPDNTDSGYTGSGRYLFKAGRYNSTGGNLTWSNEVEIEITGANTNTSSQSTTPKPSSSATTSPTASETKVLSVSTNNTQPKSNTNKINYTLPEIKGVNNEELPSPSPKTEIKSKKQVNLAFIFIGIIILSVGGFYSYLYYMKHIVKRNQIS